MKIAILGIDGYIGWPLAIHLLNKGHEICGLDNYVRRQRVRNLNSMSLTPIAGLLDRDFYISELPTFHDKIANLDMKNYKSLSCFIDFHKPDAIVHLAEQPSAPWSMKSPEHASITQQDNILGTLNLLWAMKKHCPDAHLVKLGTMGEYGTPDCDIPEGVIPEECLWEDNKSLSCPMKGLLFPRTANSFYHLSKVHDTYNINFACRTWGLTSTDIMQGVIFGLMGTDNDFKITRFDYDEYFGTVINRFCAQAISDHPLTVYGKGNQTRGFLPLKDSIQCLTLAIEQPPEKGEYRTLNQFENIYSINSLAETVYECAINLGLRPSSRNIAIQYLDNPRNEANNHYYNPAHQKLFNMGYKPTTDIQGEISNLISTLLPYKDRVNPNVIMPKTNWR